MGCAILAGACGGDGGGNSAGGARFAYAANLSSNDVSAFSINPATGALAQIDCGGGPGCNGGNFAAGTAPRSVKGTPSGKFLYVANQNSGDVSAYTVAPTGALTPIDCGGGAGCNGARFAAGSSPSSLTVDPSGKYVYVTASTGIAAFAVNTSTGALLRLGCGGGSGCSGSDFAAGIQPFAIAADPSGQFVYVANLSAGDLGGTVSAFSLNAVNGALSKVACPGGVGPACSGSEYVSGVAPFAVAVDPSGSFVQVATRASPTTGTHSSVAAYTINPSDGALIRVSCTGLGFGPACSADFPDNFLVGGDPNAVGVDPSGKFVYLAGTAGVSAYDLLPDGSLDRIDCGGGPGCNGLDFAAGANANAIAFSPSGGLAYVTSPASGVSVFAINATDGKLTRVDCGASPGCNGMDFAAGSGSSAIATLGG